MTALPWFYNDGGRKEAGFRGHTGDCVCRAICIATNKPYMEVYKVLANGMGTQRITKRAPKQRASAAHGIHTGRKWFKDYMHSLGFVFVPTMLIGSGCKVHLAKGELPNGRLIVSLSKHYAAVMNGIVHDLEDPTRDGTRCVYGYWRLT